MSTQDGPQEHDRPGPPPPPPYPQPPHDQHRPPYQPPLPQQPFAHDVSGAPGPGGRMVEVDPESAGLKRVERPGWALAFAALGVAIIGASLVFDWVEARLFDFADGGPGPRKYAGAFSAVEHVEETTARASDPPDPGFWANAVFGWLGVLLTIACVVLVLVAAVGLRRSGRTAAVRVGALVAIVATFAVVAIGYVDLGTSWDFGGGGSSSTPTVSSGAPGAPGEQEAEPEVTFDVEPHLGTAVWVLGMLVLAVAAMLGPRVVLKLPDGSTVAADSPAGHGYPSAGAFGAPGTPGYSGAPVLTRRTQLVAVVLAALGAVLCLAGYGFLSWSTGGGDTVTFSDVGEAARDVGFGSGKEIAEAYFAWLGWALLVVAIAAAVMLAVGRTGRASPKTMRPILAIAMAVAVLVHLVAMFQFEAELSIAVAAVSTGLGLSLLGALLPLRTTARVLV